MSLHALVIVAIGATTLTVAPGVVDRASGVVSFPGAGVAVTPGPFGICNFCFRDSAQAGYVGVEERVDSSDEFAFNAVVLSAASGRVESNVSMPGPGWAEVASAWDPANATLVRAGFRQPDGKIVDITALDAATGSSTVLSAGVGVTGGIQICEGAMFPGPSGAADGAFYFLTLDGVREALVEVDVASGRTRDVVLPNVDGIVTGYSGITAFRTQAGAQRLVALVYNGVAIGPIEVVLIDPASEGSAANFTRVAKAPNLCYAPAQGSPDVDPATGTFFFTLIKFAVTPDGKGCVDGNGDAAQPVLIEVDLDSGAWGEKNLTVEGVPRDPTSKDVPIVSLDWSPA